MDCEQLRVLRATGIECRWGVSYSVCPFSATQNPRTQLVITYVPEHLVQYTY